MRPHLFIFGLGFTGLRLARAAQLLGWRVSGTVTLAEKAGWITKLGINALTFDGSDTTPEISTQLEAVSHVISTIPPIQQSKAGPDPVLNCHGGALDSAWTGYLSTTGVYGDTEGAWVDEASPTGGGTNAARQAADTAWRTVSRANVFRLPGIYGPGRSVLDRAERGQLSRVDKPGHVFSRIHVDDIVQTLLAAMKQGTSNQIYNVADDAPAPAHEVEDYACHLLGIAQRPLKPYDDAALSKRAKEFYSQCRRVKNEKIKTELGVRLIYPTYKEGLQSCLAERKL